MSRTLSGPHNVRAAALSSPDPIACVFAIRSQVDLCYPRTQGRRSSAYLACWRSATWAQPSFHVSVTEGQSSLQFCHSSCSLRSRLPLLVLRSRPFPSLRTCPCPPTPAPFSSSFFFSVSLYPYRSLPTGFFFSLLKGRACVRDPSYQQAACCDGTLRSNPTQRTGHVGCLPCLCCSC